MKDDWMDVKQIAARLCAWMHLCLEDRSRERPSRHLVRGVAHGCAVYGAKDVNAG